MDPISSNRDANESILSDAGHLGDTAWCDTFLDDIASDTFASRVLKTVEFDDFWDAQPHYDALIDVSTVRFILQPNRCTVCQQNTSPLSSHLFQRICTTCQTTLDADPPLRFLHEMVAKLYTLWIKLRREEYSDSIDRVVVSGLPTVFGIKKEYPKHNNPLPDITSLLIHTGKCAHPEIVTLSPEQRTLMEEVLLTKHQCHNSVMMFEKLFEHLVSEPDSPIAEIYEMCFNPKGIPDLICNTHLMNTVTLKDSRRFAVSLTDRQFGWYPLVVPLDAYHAERVESIYLDDNGEEELHFLGDTSQVNGAHWRSQQSLSPSALEQLRALELADEVLERWKSR